VARTGKNLVFGSASGRRRTRTALLRNGGLDLERA